jgi:hypothetical protein
MKHTAVVLMTGVVNGNGRIYQHDDVVKAVEQAQERVRAGVMLGYLVNGPSMSDTPPQTGEESHVVRELLMERDHVVATIETLETEQGKLLAKMLSAGDAVLRTRASGIPNDNNVITEVEFISVVAMSKDVATPLRK